MKYRRLTLAAIVATVGVAALALVWSRPTGPTYEGKSVAQWFKLYRSTSCITDQEDARDAFQALGDQAAPYLLSVIARSERLSPARAYAQLWSRLPRQLQRLLPAASTEMSPTHFAYELLRAMRPSATVVLPRIKPWLSSPEHPQYWSAIGVLGTLGPGGSEGVPFLIQALQSTNRNDRGYAMQNLQQLGAEARPALPVLLTALDDPATRTRAIRALGNIGPDAKVALPQLDRFLDPTNRVFLAAAVAVHKINPDGSGLRLLIDAVRDPQRRLPAIDQLGELGPAAVPALDVVLEALRAEGGRDRVGGPAWITIADALHKISPTNRAVIPILIEKLREAEQLARQNTTTGSVAVSAYGPIPLALMAKSDRLNIAAKLLHFDPAEAHALEVLTEVLRSDPEPGSRDFAAYALRQAGPGARAAIPALKAALNDKDKAVRRAAASALRKIEQPGAK